MMMATGAVDILGILGRVDWSKWVGVPAAVLVVLGLANGVVHALAVKRPVYWHDKGKTKAKLSVKYRLVASDCNVTAVAFYRIPKNIFKRHFTKWRERQGGTPACVPQGLTLESANVTITRQARKTFTFELQTATAQSAEFKLEDDVRIEVQSGDKHSRLKKFKFLET